MKTELESLHFAHCLHTQPAAVGLVLSRITKSNHSVLVECHFEHCRIRSTQYTVRTGCNRPRIHSDRMFPWTADYNVKSTKQYTTRTVYTCMGYTHMHKLHIRFLRL